MAAITPQRVIEQFDGAHNVLAYSGGKDSTAMYLYAMEQGIDPDRYEVVFADVGNEHEATLEFVETLPDKVGGPPIRRVQADLTGRFESKREVINTKWRKDGVPEEIIERAMRLMKPTGNVFLDVCLLHTLFPGPNRRFCTQELKIWPTWDQVCRPHWEEHKLVITWQGLRREESNSRAKLPTFQREVIPGMLQGRALPPVRRQALYRPILEWDLSKVFSIHHRFGIDTNPLYEKGFTRVGCMPCIMAGKDELRLIGEVCPEHIDKIEEWEALINQVKRVDMPATFISAIKTRGKHYHHSTTTIENAGIRAAVADATRVKAGGDMDLFDTVELDVKPGLSTLDGDGACNLWGACE